MHVLDGTIHLGIRGRALDVHQHTDSAPIITVQNSPTDRRRAAVGILLDQARIGDHGQDVSREGLCEFPLTRVYDAV
jgi:hypothetical protein